MLFDHQRTPLDLRFRLWRFPVTVNPFFWLGMAVLGQGAFKFGMEYGLMWVACGFVSILWHELGHTFAMSHYGSPARIELFAFGGLAIPSYQSPSPWRRMAIAAAGPAAGFGLLAVVWGSNQATSWSVQSPHLLALYLFLYQINLFWNLLNLLPIWPLDGSKIVREALVVRRLRQPDYTAQQISFVTAVFLGVVGLVVNFGPKAAVEPVVENWPDWLRWAIPGDMMTLFVFLFAFQSYQLMQQYRRPRLYVTDDRTPWER